MLYIYYWLILIYKKLLNIIKFTIIFNEID